jgi:ribosomal protein S18 acetylase RimI-like enzyme
MQAIIRTLRAEDYKSIRDIYHDAFDCHNLPVKDLGTSWRNRSAPDSYGIVSPDGDLLGFAIVSFHKKNGTNRYLDYLAVHSTLRGQDLGSKLLTHIIDICRVEKSSIHLYPVKSDRIKAWYKSHGFRDTNDGYMNLHFYETRMKG